MSTFTMLARLQTWRAIIFSRVCLWICLSVCLWTALLPFTVNQLWRNLVTRTLLWSSLAATIVVQIGRRGTVRRLFFIHLLCPHLLCFFNCCIRQSFSTTLLWVFCGLPLGLEAAQFVVHVFFTQSFTYFLEKCPSHLHLFFSTTVITSSLPSLCQLITCEPVCYCNTTYPSDHSCLGPRKRKSRTDPLSGLFSGTTRVSWHQKG